jgi:hypothetical protein
VRRADNLTTFMCQLSRNLGASTSWNPVGLSRPVMGLLYLLRLGYKLSASRVNEELVGKPVGGEKSGVKQEVIAASDIRLHSLPC